MENYIIAYDIADDRRRYKTFKAIKEYAVPVQFSLFEGILSNSDILKLKSRLKKILDDDEDSLIIYKQCTHCKTQVERMGKTHVLYGEDDIIV